MNKIFYFLIFFLISISASFFTIGCGEPNTEGMNQNCKSLVLCMWLNKENHDKSICAKLGEACPNSNNFIECSSNTKIDMRDCMLLLK